MIHILLILTFVSMHLHDAGAAADPAPARSVALFVAGTLLMLWAGFHAAAATAGRQMDRAGRIGAIVWAEKCLTVARLAAGAALLYAILGLGWLDAVRATMGDWVLLDELATVAPLVAFFAATWWSMYPVDRRVKEAVLWRELHEGVPLHAPMTRGEFVWHSVRHGVLLVLVPLSIMTAWQEALIFSESRWQLRDQPWWQWGGPLLTWGGLIGVVILTPALLRYVWDTTLLKDGDIADQVHRVCARHKVRVKGPLLWRTHGTILNGAVLGVFWPFRYMLFTDALLERLTRDEVEGVVAHEVAHVRHLHVVWIAVSIGAAVVGLAWGAVAAQFVLNMVRLPLPAAEVVVTVVSLIGTAAVFGWVSRRFEWQADAFAVSHLSGASPVVTPQAAAVMAGALGSVAGLNGMSMRKFDWRHGSIAHRQQRILALVGQHVGDFGIDRAAAWIKVVAGVVLGLGALPILWMWFFTRVGT